MSSIIIADRYQVLRELGRGGMGVVYQVLHLESQKHYALKALLAQTGVKADQLTRFNREVKLPSRIQSEHIVQVIESGTAPELNGVPYYVMDLLRGCDLRRLLEIPYRPTPAEALWVLRQVARGMDRAHAIGVVHRDLKPDNIFLHFPDSKQLVAKILDFGIARINEELLESGDRGKLTATQSMLGTPLYMAPEQAKGKDGTDEISPRTDVWAVGMIAFELLTGRPYWDADNILQLLAKLMFAPIAPPSSRVKSLSANFDEWFARSCNRDIGQRFESVGSQIEALTTALTVAAIPEEPSPALVKAVRGQTPKLIESDGPTLMERPSKASAEMSTIAAPPNPFDSPSEIAEEPSNAENETIAKLPKETPNPWAEPAGGTAAIRILSPWLRKNLPWLLRLVAIPATAIAIWLLGSLIIKAPTPAGPQTLPDLAQSIPDLAQPVDLSPPPDLTPAAKKFKTRKNSPLKPQIPNQPTGQSKRVKAYIPPSL